MIINPNQTRECPAGFKHAGFVVRVNSEFCRRCPDRMKLFPENHSSFADFICNNETVEKKFADELAKEPAGMYDDFEEGYDRYK